MYRLPGRFWFKEVVLPIYRQRDHLDNALTPLEEAALAHILCSPDTSYGDVAGQMFVVQAIVPPEQFALFQRLAAQGDTVIKYPRSGRPAKKTFRFSFVEGNIYLTWKGKFGNQGVGMSEVVSIVGGIGSEVLRWSVKDHSKAEQFLSINCVDRSVDLFFESEIDRNRWRDLLKALVMKEQGDLGLHPSIDVATTTAAFGCNGNDNNSLTNHSDNIDAFDSLILCTAIGKHLVSPTGAAPFLLPSSSST